MPTHSRANLSLFWGSAATAGNEFDNVQPPIDGYTTESYVGHQLYMSKIICAAMKLHSINPLTLCSVCMSNVNQPLLILVYITCFWIRKVAMTLLKEFTRWIIGKVGILKVLSTSSVTVAGFSAVATDVFLAFWNGLNFLFVVVSFLFCFFYWLFFVIDIIRYNISFPICPIYRLRIIDGKFIGSSIYGSTVISTSSSFTFGW